mmetsp:Transcript_74660/g.180485  ORF Transcript_74660/g.180485 Transcript_74660/m.180485 type:complete len:257 (+) Transcript_74660:2783-3553(+)
MHCSSWAPPSARHRSTGGIAAAWTQRSPSCATTWARASASSRRPSPSSTRGTPRASSASGSHCCRLPSIVSTPRGTTCSPSRQSWPSPSSCWASRSSGCRSRSPSPSYRWRPSATPPSVPYSTTWYWPKTRPVASTGLSLRVGARIYSRRSLRVGAAGRARATTRRTMRQRPSPRRLRRLSPRRLSPRRMSARRMSHRNRRGRRRSRHGRRRRRRRQRRGRRRRLSARWMGTRAAARAARGGRGSTRSQRRAGRPR